MKRNRKTKLEKQEFELRIKRMTRQVLLSIDINNHAIERKISSAILIGAKAVDPKLEAYFSGNTKPSMKELTTMQMHELTGLLDLLKAREIFQKVHVRIKEIATKNKVNMSNVMEEDLSHVKSA